MIDVTCGNARISRMKAIEKIDKYLQDRGVSATTLAKHLDISPNRIYKWRSSGEGQPSPEQLVKVAEFFNVDPQYFLNPNMDQPPAPKLTDDEWFLVMLYRALRISRDEAARRLSADPHKHDLHQPIAGHRGEHGSPDERGSMSARAQTKHTSV